MFAFIESLGYLPSQHSVYRAYNYQHNGIKKGDHVGGVDVRVAD